MYLFKNPYFLFLLLLLPGLVYYYFKIASKSRASIKFSSLHNIKTVTPSKILKYRHFIFFFRLACLSCLILALGRPLTGKKNTFIKSEGIDIILCLDISFSMRGEDMEPKHRLAAAKEVLVSFVEKRVNDRMGLVVYGSEAYLQCPLTLDHGVLIDFIRRVDFVPELENQTAIGMAMIKGVNSLKESRAKSKVIILLTDGANNAGDIDPITASELANTFDMKVYAIGMGKPGLSEVMVTFNDPYKGPHKGRIANDMNEGTLEEIAENTGGLYFNAQNRQKLFDVYKKINELEKTEIQSNQYLDYNEQFGLFVWLGLGFLMAEIILNNTRFRRIP